MKDTSRMSAVTFALKLHEASVSGNVDSRRLERNVKGVDAIGVMTKMRGGSDPLQGKP